jgi:predicted site-specific integrase-resolvase
MDALLSPRVAAEILDISIKTLTGHTNNGEIHYIDVG